MAHYIHGARSQLCLHVPFHVGQALSDASGRRVVRLLSSIQSSVQKLRCYCPPASSLFCSGLLTERKMTMTPNRKDLVSVLEDLIYRNQTHLTEVDIPLCGERWWSDKVLSRCSELVLQRHPLEGRPLGPRTLAMWASRTDILLWRQVWLGSSLQERDDEWVTSENITNWLQKMTFLEDFNLCRVKICPDFRRMLHLPLKSISLQICKVNDDDEEEEEEQEEDDFFLSFSPSILDIATPYGYGTLGICLELYPELRKLRLDVDVPHFEPAGKWTLPCLQRLAVNEFLTVALASGKWRVSAPQLQDLDLCANGTTVTKTMTHCAEDWPTLQSLVLWCFRLDKIDNKDLLLACPTSSTVRHVSVSFENSYDNKGKPKAITRFNLTSIFKHWLWRFPSLESVDCMTSNLDLGPVMCATCFDDPPSDRPFRYLYPLPPHPHPILSIPSRLHTLLGVALHWINYPGLRYEFGLIGQLRKLMLILDDQSSGAGLLANYTSSTLTELILFAEPQDYDPTIAVLQELTPLLNRIKTLTLRGFPVFFTWPAAVPTITMTSTTTTIMPTKEPPPSSLRCLTLEPHYGGKAVPLSLLSQSFCRHLIELRIKSWDSFSVLLKLSFPPALEILELNFQLPDFAFLPSSDELDQVLEQIHRECPRLQTLGLPLCCSSNGHFVHHRAAHIFHTLHSRHSLQVLLCS